MGFKKNPTVPYTNPYISGGGTDLGKQTSSHKAPKPTRQEAIDFSKTPDGIAQAADIQRQIDAANKVVDAEHARQLIVNKFDGAPAWALPLYDSLNDHNHAASNSADFLTPDNAVPPKNTFIADEMKMNADLALSHAALTPDNALPPALPDTAHLTESLHAVTPEVNINKAPEVNMNNAPGAPLSQADMGGGSALTYLGLLATGLSFLLG